MALYLESSVENNDCVHSDVIGPTTTWQNTTLALRCVENLLRCSVCKEVLKNPYTYTTCYHHFCQGCIKAECGLKCPVCDIPIWSKDLVPNFQLANVVMLVQHMKSLIAEDSQPSVKQENIKKVDDGVQQVHRTEHTVLKPNIAVLKETKEDRTPIDRRLNPAIINSPVKQTKLKDKVRKSKGMDEAERDQLLSSLNKKTHEIRNPNELSQPRIKRRRVLSNAVHNSCTAQQLDANFPFSPIYKRTRSFHKKALPISNLTIQQKCSRQGSEVEQLGGQENIDNVGPTDGECSDNISKRFKTPKRINHKGETMLHVLAMKGDVNVINKLLQDGDDPNVKDYAGWTPLHEACNHGHHAVVDLLLSNGAVINIPGYANCTPLHDAVLNGHLDIVKLLIAKGADPCIHNKYGKRPDDLTDDLEIKKALQLCSTIDSYPQTLKSPHVSNYAESSLCIHIVRFEFMYLTLRSASASFLRKFIC